MMKAIQNRSWVTIIVIFKWFLESFLSLQETFLMISDKDNQILIDLGFTLSKKRGIRQFKKQVKNNVEVSITFHFWGKRSDWFIFIGKYPWNNVHDSFIYGQDNYKSLEGILHDEQFRKYCYKEYTALRLKNIFK